MDLVVEQPANAPNSQNSAHSAPQKSDGSLDKVDKTVIEASKDVEQWIAERKRKWPTKERVEQRKKQALETNSRTKTAELQTSDSSAVNSRNGSDGSNNRTQTVPKRICKFYARGNCRHGDNCKFLHEGSKRSNGKRPAYQETGRVYKRYEAPVKGSLFLKLVQNDLDKEDDQLLEVIKWLYANGELTEEQTAGETVENRDNPAANAANNTTTASTANTATDTATETGIVPMTTAPTGYTDTSTDTNMASDTGTVPMATNDHSTSNSHPEKETTVESVDSVDTAENLLPDVHTNDSIPATNPASQTTDLEPATVPSDSI